MLRFKLKERVADLEFREQRRVALGDIADATGVGRATLTRMNRGMHVRTETLERLCAYFGCRVEDLVEYVSDDAVKPSVGRTTSSEQAKGHRSRAKH